MGRPVDTKKHQLKPGLKLHKGVVIESEANLCVMPEFLTTAFIEKYRGDR